MAVKMVMMITPKGNGVGGGVNEDMVAVHCIMYHVLYKNILVPQSTNNVNIQECCYRSYYVSCN